MTYDFKTFKDGVSGVEEWLKKEFAGIRTGRATPALLDSVMVEAYGSFMPISNVASISVEPPRMIRITPWDATQNKAIEKALVASDLGLAVGVDEKGIRVNFPELTSDRRVQLIKVAKQKLEDARISIRSEREKTLKDIEAKEDEGEISEDERFRLKAELQKIIDASQASLETLFAKKENEINE